MRLLYTDGSFEVKDIDAPTGRIKGHAAVYGNVDSGNDVILHGAGKKTISERRDRIKACYGHDLSKLVGHPVEIAEDEKGLMTVTQLAVKSFWGNEVYELAKNGSLSELSIGYNPIQAKNDPRTGTRSIAEYKLIEYSFVPLAMNEQARVTDVKSLLDGLSPTEKAERLLALLHESKHDFATAGDWDAHLQAVQSELSALLVRDPGGEKADPIAAQAAAMATDLRRIELDRLMRGRMV